MPIPSFNEQVSAGTPPFSEYGQMIEIFHNRNSSGFL
jgi:hypothetical protein